MNNFILFIPKHAYRFNVARNTGIFEGECEESATNDHAIWSWLNIVTEMDIDIKGSGCIVHPTVQGDL